MDDVTNNLLALPDASFLRALSRSPGTEPFRDRLAEIAERLTRQDDASRG